jgi:type II secretory pathway pseudopilin PulG
VRIPSGHTTVEIAYAFADGYLIIASSRNSVADAIRLHHSGGSLAKSKAFLAALPAGHTSTASALLYEDPIAMTALRLRQISPQMAESLSQSAGVTAPAVVGVYGEESAIREASKNSAFDAAGVLIVAAIAIPNLMRSKVAANEAGAVGSVRVVNSGQAVYATLYPKRGYAPSLSVLGPDPRAASAKSPDHAGILDERLGDESCTADAWCNKSGYHFRVTAVCDQHHCKEFVVIATPVDSNTGTRSFCSTSDGVIRSKTGPPLAVPVSVSECRAWLPLK